MISSGSASQTGLSGLWRRCSVPSLVARPDVEIGHSAQQLSLLFAEVIAELVRIQQLIARVRRHATQPPVGLGHFAALVFRQVVVLLEQVAGVCLLLRRHVFEVFHPVQDLRLFLRWLAVEVAQTVEQLVLLLLWQTAKAGIMLQLLLLLAGGKTSVFPQPIAVMWPRTLGMKLVAVVGVWRTRRWRSVPRRWACRPRGRRRLLLPSQKR